MGEPPSPSEGGRRFTVPRVAARNIAWGFISVALLLWIVTLVIEVWTPHPLQNVEELLAASEPADDFLAVDAPTEDKTIEPNQYLPSAVEGWYVQGVQVVPGSSGRVFEGNYVPRDEARSLVTPLNVYAQATESGQGAESDLVARALESRYPDKQEQYSIDGVIVSSGYSADGGSYFVGWEDKGKVYGVDATFRFRIPEEHARGQLRPSADEIARAIMSHTPGLGGVE
jgi:hypothetical protein